MKNIIKTIKPKTIIVFILTAILYLSNPSFCLAQLDGNRVADTSASLNNTQTSYPKDIDLLIKEKVISRVLQNHNSPLQPYARSFVDMADHYGLNIYLLPAISKLESSFGHAVIPGKYNPFGWGSGTIGFANWGEGIAHVARALRFNYVDRGATSVSQIGRIYAASPTWAQRVERFIHEFELEEQKLLQELGNNIVKKV